MTRHLASEVEKTHVYGDQTLFVTLPFVLTVLPPTNPVLARTFPLQAHVSVPQSLPQMCFPDPCLSALLTAF